MILYVVDIPQTITGAVGIVSLIGTVYKIIQWYHKRTMSEIMINREENKKLTNDIKIELINHTKEDNTRFNSIEDKFSRLMDVSSRTDEKVTLLINNKIK